MKRIVFALALSALPAAAFAQSPSPSPAPSPAPSASPAVEDLALTKIARQQFDQWKSGNPDLSAYVAGSEKSFTPDVKTQVKGFLATLGDVQSFKYAGKQQSPGGTVVDKYQITGSKASAIEFIHRAADGKIDLIFFAPPQL
ncbi:MAG: hypothetical protein JO165_07355 [Candidatus Eremiobacteraeota bacterium]|nr:hypothetical protein [Candidatus Eremiobacteraeota bacterium]